MSEKTFFQKRVFPIIFMLVITLVFISVTTVIYTFTQDIIKINESLVLKRAILKAAGFEVLQAAADVEKLYKDAVSEVKDQNDRTLYYIITKPGLLDVQGYVIVSTGSGLWGDITAAIGINSAKDQLTGIDIIAQNETPGLGGRITEPWFTNQFKGKRGPLSLVPEGETANSNEVQAITGASYSSAAMKAIVNSTLQDAQRIIKS